MTIDLGCAASASQAYDQNMAVPLRSSSPSRTMAASVPLGLGLYSAVTWRGSGPSGILPHLPRPPPAATAAKARPGESARPPDPAARGTGSRGPYARPLDSNEQ